MFRGRHEKKMYYVFQVLFKVFLKIYYLAEVISLWLCNWRLKVCLFLQKKKSYKIYRSFKRSYRNILYYNRNRYFNIIKNNFRHIFLCWIFLFYICVFVSLIFFPDVDDFSCGCFLFSCFFPFDILFLYILFSFENESSLLFCCIAWMKLETILFIIIFYKQFEMIQV